MREKRHVERIVEQRAERLKLTAIYIYGITETLEGEETDAHRQENVLRLEVAVHELRPYFTEEIGIFEISEQREVYYYTQREQ